MQGESVIFQGRMIPKAGFRTFVYNKSNSKVLLNSWDEYEQAMKTGDFFDEPQAIKDNEPLIFSTLKKRAKK